MIHGGASRCGGFSMVEVLVTMLILMFGLLGLASLQGRSLTAQMESYQRSQALVLVKDMANRISSNFTNSGNYVTGSALGTTIIDNCAALGTRQQIDSCEWNNALKGAAETKGTSKVGAMVGARGCVDVLTATEPRKYMIAVAWQGINKTAAPPASVTCGANEYGDEKLRRVITLTVIIPKLN